MNHDQRMLHALTLSLQFGKLQDADLHRAALPRHKVARWLRHALASDAEITVRIVDAPEGQDLNRAYRKKDYATNVLTFDYTLQPVVTADLVLCASGSATLETALLERPMVVMYRLAPVTYAVARLLVRVPFIGMPNLILGKRAVPELVQHEVTAGRIAAEARAILLAPLRAAAIRADLARVRASLGQGGAARRAAAIAAEMLDGESGSRRA